MVILNQIERILKEKDITEAQLAQLADLPRMTVFNARRGKNVTIQTATKIAKALGKTLDEVFPMVKEESKEKVA